MVDLVITPANVVPVVDAFVDKVVGLAGVTILAGQVVYRDPTTRKFMLADSNSATADARVPVGIALHGASLNQPLTVQKGGNLALGATLAVGTIYCLSETPGGIQPHADLTSGEYVTVLGVATLVTNLKMGLLVSGAAVP